MSAVCHFIIIVNICISVYKYYYSAIESVCKSEIFAFLIIFLLILLSFPRKNIIFTFGGVTSVKAANVIIPSHEIVTLIITLSFIILGLYMMTKFSSE